MPALVTEVSREHGVPCEGESRQLRQTRCTHF